MKIHNRIEAYAEKPVSAASKLAVLLPGYLDNCNYDHLARLAKDLCEAGYFVVRFNPTGTWDSAGEISEYCTSQFSKDVSDVINWAEKENGKNFEQRIIAGHSFGGQIALQYSLTRNDIDAAIGIMPSFGKFEEDEILLQWQKMNFKESKRLIPGSNEFRFFRVPFSFLEDRKKYPIEKLNSSACPKLIVAGGLDDVVPVDLVKKYFDGFSEPKRFVELKNIGHDYRLNNVEISEVDNVILDYLSGI